MSILNQENADLLAIYDIILKKESKTSAILQLKNKNNESKISSVLYEKLIDAIKNGRQNNIKLPKITFGVELEFVGSKDLYDLSAFNTAMYHLLKEKYFYSGVYTHNDGNSWILGRDSSIKFNDTLIENPFGYELSSPKLDLFNYNDIIELQSIIELIKTYLHGEVNNSCGTHIHIGFNRENTYRGSICDLLSVYSYMESKVFDPIVPKSRRRNKFCKKTESYIRNKYQKLSSRFCEFNYDGECRNLHFEFRQLEGTLDVNTIIYWAKLQAYVLYDLLDHIYDDNYRVSLVLMNIFEILFNYDFDNDLINFFIDRVIEFKSRTIQS